MLVLVDIVRVLDHNHRSWLLDQAPFLDWLNRRRWEQHATLLIAGGLVLAGAWCVLAALLPGGRDLLPMRSPSRSAIGYLSATSAAAALRASALGVENVVGVRVRLGRRSAKVKIRIAAGDQSQFDEVNRRARAAVERR
ncbi:MAG: DUF6286 domain-containing protein, partial [Steroidobacteraceae bacterium]